LFEFEDFLLNISEMPRREMPLKMWPRLRFDHNSIYHYKDTFNVGNVGLLIVMYVSSRIRINNLNKVFSIYHYYKYENKFLIESSGEKFLRQFISSKSTFDSNDTHGH